MAKFTIDRIETYEVEAESKEAAAKIAVEGVGDFETMGVDYFHVDLSTDKHELIEM